MFEKQMLFVANVSLFKKKKRNSGIRLAGQQQDLGTNLHHVHIQNVPSLFDHDFLVIPRRHALVHYYTAFVQKSRCFYLFQRVRTERQKGLGQLNHCDLLRIHNLIYSRLWRFQPKKSLRKTDNRWNSSHWRCAFLVYNGPIY